MIREEGGKEVKKCVEENFPKLRIQGKLGCWCYIVVRKELRLRNDENVNPKVP